jgi:hypothetical protein
LHKDESSVAGAYGETLGSTSGLKTTFASWWWSWGLQLLLLALVWGCSFFTQVFLIAQRVSWGFFMTFNFLHSFVLFYFLRLLNFLVFFVFFWGDGGYWKI